MKIIGKKNRINFKYIGKSRNVFNVLHNVLCNRLIKKNIDKEWDYKEVEQHKTKLWVQKIAQLFTNQFKKIKTTVNSV